MDDLNRKSVEEFKRSEKTPVIAVLENIRSAYNVGSVFRTADAFLLESIQLCGYTPQPPHRDIQKTALGATETVSWKYVKQAEDAVRDLKQAGYAVFAVEQTEKSIPLHQFPELMPERFALVFGNEVSGVEDPVLILCDGSIEIPQLGMKHSLNISVAAGIVFWEILRSKPGAGPTRENTMNNL